MIYDRLDLRQPLKIARSPFDRHNQAPEEWMEGTTRRMAEFCAATRYEQLPPEVVREAKRLLLDTAGCALGAVGTDSGRIALQYARALGGTPQASVVGTGERNSAANAAYANGRLANVLDGDDTFPTGTHFGCSTVFAALAAGEQRSRSGRDLIAAIAVGFDVAARMGSAMGAPILIEDGKVVGYVKVYGVSATMTWAAAAAAANIAQIGPQRTAQAFGIAGANTPLPAHGKWSASVKLPMHKYADAGWCAQTGVSATLLAELGSTGYADILDGEPAFWQFFGAQKGDVETLLRGLGTTWHLLNTTYKPWPSCRWTQYPLTAFMQIKQEEELKPEEIERVVVKANPMAQSARFKLQQPESEINGEFSHAHVIAMGAYDIPGGPRWYVPEVLNAPEIRAFRSRVSVELEPSAANIAQWMEGGQFRRIPGGVEVHARGKVFSRIVEMAWGDPWSEESRFSDEALRDKFMRMVEGSRVDGMTGGAKPARREQAQRIIEAVDNLESLKDVNDFGRLLALETAVRQAA